ncbi:hypothetical protein B8W72_07010 [Pseudomonas putida]|uniref:Uncharacterized protein n=1 Tax=Pseudomonas putida TaxID=303 RepID=A0A1Y3LJF9_PSEPU|nr:hypothetical protein B8W72_07010 [Pseudomonas putida]
MGKSSQTSEWAVIAWKTLECREDLAVDVGFLRAGSAYSRVNPLPQGLHCFRNLYGTCGSGFTRE